MRAIVAMETDLVLRNLRVTQMYHQLAVELSEVLRSTETNWSNFACWASKTAGQAIRREEPSPFVNTLITSALAASPEVERWCQRLPLGGSPLATAWREIFGALDASLQLTSDHISAGNLKVFAELAPIFVRFIDAFGQERAPEPRRLATFLMSLRPGPSSEGGQDALRQAFIAWHAARYEQDPKQKSELILLGNVLIGLHEQTRLQINIADGMNAIVTHGVRKLVVDRVADLLERCAPAVKRALRARFGGDLRARVTERLATLWRLLATFCVMSISTPGKPMALGREIDRLPDGRVFPERLEQVVRPDLRRALQQFDWSFERPIQSAARDWADLGERMNWICDLFRSRQFSRELFDQPFTVAQRAAMAWSVQEEGSFTGIEHAHDESATHDENAAPVRPQQGAVLLFSRADLHASTAAVTTRPLGALVHAARSGSSVPVAARGTEVTSEVTSHEAGPRRSPGSPRVGATVLALVPRSGAPHGAGSPQLLRAA